jgi:hypothetical protein
MDWSTDEMANGKTTDERSFSWDGVNSGRVLSSSIDAFGVGRRGIHLGVVNFGAVGGVGAFLLDFGKGWA